MDQTQYIIAGSLIDGSGFGVQRNVYLAVNGSTITAVGPVSELPSGNGATINDFSYCTFLPALVDCTVSLSQSPSVDMSTRLSTKESDFNKTSAMLERHSRYCHIYGVLGVADGDDHRGFVKRYQDEIMQEKLIDIRTSGRLCRTRQDCDNARSTGNEFLKVGYSANIDENQTRHPQLNVEELRSILQSRERKKTVVVANGQLQVKEAIEEGCDAVEQGYSMGEENLRKIAEKDILWIPSILRAKNSLDGSSSGGDVCCRFSQRYVAPGKPIPGAEAFWKKMLDEQLEQLRLARKFGVRTALGTGAGSVGILHGEAMIEEMKLFIKAGYSLEETIRCASDTGAEFFDMEQLGALVVGRRATFLMVRGTPKQLPRKLSYLEGIYIDGAPSTIYHKHPLSTS